VHCEDVTLAAQGYAWQPPNRLLEDDGGPLARPGVTVAVESVTPDEDWGRHRRLGGGRGTRPPTESQRERSRLGTARARQWVNLPLVALDLVGVAVARAQTSESRVACAALLCVDPWARAEQRVCE